MSFIRPSALTTQYVAASVCLLTVTVGVVSQFRGAASARVGVLPEHRASLTAALTPERKTLPVHKLVIAFERELVGDLGDIQTRIANLLSYSSVIASLTVNFPSQWIVGLGLYCASLLVVAYSGWRGLDQMVRKRSRQQHLFRTTPDIAERDALVRDFASRHRKFASSDGLSLIRKMVIVIREAEHTAKRYVPKDP